MLPSLDTPSLDSEPRLLLDDVVGTCEPRALVVAVSGGGDSVYLLRQARAWATARNRPVQALHFNHRLRGAESDGDEAFVRALCMRLAVPLTVARPALADDGPGNRQALARRQRRRALEEAAGDRGWILLGHQAWDRSETVAGALIKGKVPWGLAALRPVVDGRWLRPLLELGADEIRSRLASAGQDWREDSTNRRPGYERNALRLRLLAPLRDFHGARLDILLGDLAKTCIDGLETRDRLRDDLLENLDLRPEYCGHSLERAALFPYHDEIALAAIESLGRRLGAWRRSPGRSALAVLVDWLRHGRGGAQRPVGGGWRVALDRRRAWFHREDPPPPPVRSLGPGDEFSACGRVWGRSPRPAPTGAWTTGLLPEETSQPLALRPWRPGDRIEVAEGVRRSVADLLGEAGLNPLDKRRQTVLEAGGRLLALPGLRRAWCPRGEQRKRSTSIIWMVP